MNITAKEIERQAGRVDVQVERLSSNISTMKAELRSVVNITKSEDSSLSRDAQQTIDTLVTLEKNIRKNFTKLAGIMHDYSNKTITNEGDMAVEVKQINSTMEDIANQLNAMEIE